MPLPVGTKAPDFTLKTKKGNDLLDVRLSDRLGEGNVVLLFFPAAFTGVCTSEMCDVTAGLKSFGDLHTEVFGISVDSPFAQEAWALREKIGFTLLSDFDKQVIKDYDVVLESLAGVGVAAKRAAYVIDRQGVIQYAEVTPTPKDLPNLAAVKARLVALDGE